MTDSFTREIYLFFSLQFSKLKVWQTCWIHICMKVKEDLIYCYCTVQLVFKNRVRSFNSQEKEKLFLLQTLQKAQLLYLTLSMLLIVVMLKLRPLIQRKESKKWLLCLVEKAHQYKEQEEQEEFSMDNALGFTQRIHIKKCLKKLSLSYLELIFQLLYWSFLG